VILAVFAVTSTAVLVALPWSLSGVLKYLGHPVSEPEVKFVFLLLLGLGGLATAARSEAVLPAYLLGLVAAGVFHRDPRLRTRIRATAFSVLTPFFFLKAGTLIVLQSVIAGIGSIALLFAVKVVAKVIGVFPATRMFQMRGRQAWYTTMMMSTGLTFGSISALFGLTHGYIDRGQYSILVTVVVLTALVPTLIAQVAFHPTIHALQYGLDEPLEADVPDEETA
jgi:Kef-type K+ transport system membrane component KefB